MINFNRLHKQDITYWAPGAGSYEGGESYATPVRLKGRWQGKTMQVRRATGEEVTSSSQVFLTTAIKEGGYLYEGVSSVVNPHAVAEAREIQAVGKTTDLRNVQTLYTAML